MVFRATIDRLEEFSKEFWAAAKNSKVFAFYGEMGAGKTTIITALCKEKGVKDTISSPTFSIINEYEYEDSGRACKIYHMDLYRLKSMEEVIQAGVEDCIYSGDLCFVEWPEKAPGLLDDQTLHISIKNVADDVRELSLERTRPSHL